MPSFFYDARELTTTSVAVAKHVVVGQLNGVAAAAEDGARAAVQYLRSSAFGHRVAMRAREKDRTVRARRNLRNGKENETGRAFAFFGLSQRSHASPAYFTDSLPSATSSPHPQVG